MLTDSLTGTVTAPDAIVNCATKQIAIGGTVINTDSMQVYRDLRIITARPTPEEEARLPHRLYGHVDAGLNYSAGAWVADAAKVLGEAHAEGRIPIFIITIFVIFT